MLKSKRKVLVGLSVVVVATTTIAFAAAQRNGTEGAALTALDYIEIQQLYGRYDRLSDSGSGRVDEVYAPDGILITPERTDQGFAKLREHHTRAMEPPRGSTNVWHFITGMIIEPSREGAIGYAHCLLVRIPRDGTPNVVSGAGIFEDIFVKTPDGWRIKKRVYMPANSGPPAGMRTLQESVGYMPADRGR